LTGLQIQGGQERGWISRTCHQPDDLILLVQRLLALLDQFQILQFEKLRLLAKGLEFAQPLLVFADGKPLGQSQGGEQEGRQDPPCGDRGPKP
jgi:hypothetical protein